MSYHHAYLRTATGIINSYKGDEPFSSFLKKYFAVNPKHGSRDRKQITQLCYSFFRTGKAAPGTDTEKKIITGLFLGSPTPNEILQNLEPEWNQKTNLPVEEKAAIAGITLTDVFPWQDEWSAGIDAEKFNSSFFIQPDLFLRVRPLQDSNVISKLEDSGLDFKLIPPSTLRFPPASKTEKWLLHDKEAVVQDLNSQRVGEFMEEFKQLVRRGPSDQLKIWDCCAASGGKSILAKDILGTIELTVSDVRESILVNLKKRFAAAGIHAYKSFVNDLAGGASFLVNEQDLVIADVPCTGSGTWGRTPEQLYYFNKEKITEYSKLQSKIVSAVIPSIKNGGCLLYITCSVFRKENEEMIQFLENKFQLRLVKAELLKGYELKADTLFAALLEKKL